MRRLEQPRLASGPVPSSCSACGRGAVRDARWSGPVGCVACWAAAYGIDTMRPIAVPAHLRVRYAGGSIPVLGQGPAMRSRRRLEVPVQDPRSAAAATAVARRELSADAPEVPRFNRKPLPLAAIAAAGYTWRLTLATAEAEQEDGPPELIESVALRVRGLGWAVWVDGRPSSACAWTAGRGPHRCSVGELVTRAQGLPWQPPPKPAEGPCPACGRSVRWKEDGIAYKHLRAPGEPCVPDAPTITTKGMT